MCKLHKNSKTPFVVLDIEFLAKQKTVGKNKYYFPSITEIGAVKYSPETNKIIEEFHSFCKVPYLKLSALDRKITKITNSDVDNAPDFASVLEELNSFCKNCKVYSWGPADYSVLRKNADKNNAKLNFYVHDGQRSFQKKLEKRIPISVSDALIHIGDFFEGEKHSALSDAYNECKIFTFMFS